MDYNAWKLPEVVQKALKHKPPFILNITDRIDQKMVDRLLRDLSGIKDGEPLLLWFNSPGGDIQSGRLLISHLNMLKVPIVSLAAGAVDSMALIIYLSIPKKTRFALPGSTFLAHFASSRPGSFGQVDIDGRRIAGLKKKAAMRLASLRWDQAIESDKFIRGVVRDTLGKHITVDGVTISVEEFMSYDQNIPAEVAMKIGIVNKIV